MELKLTGIPTERERAINHRIQALRAETADLSDYQRVEVWDALKEGYCPHCGTRTENRTCYCTQDE